MLDSLFSLMRDNDFTFDDVVNAEVDQSYYSVVMLYQEPDDDLKGKFSAKYNVAAALVDGEVNIDTFTQKKIDDPTMGEVMDKVRTRVMAKSEELLTNSEDGLKVKITLKDGARLRAHHRAGRHPRQPEEPVGLRQHQGRVRGERGPGAERRRRETRRAGMVRHPGGHQRRRAGPQHPGGDQGVKPFYLGLSGRPLPESGSGSFVMLRKLTRKSYSN